MPGSLLGNSVRRVEDPHFLTGHGTYVANLRFDDLVVTAFVRSPFAHARIGHVDVDEARRAPGVVAVYTADDLGLAPFHGFMVLNPACGRPPLATGKVRFVGDVVAMVLAESEAAAVDAAELVVVDYDPLDAAVDLEAAVADGAPLQFEELGTNVVAGMADPADPDLLAGATTVVRAKLENQRVAVVPMEGDAVVAVPGDAAGGDEHDLTVYVSTQMPHGVARTVATTLGLDQSRVRVVAPDVGGGFGAKPGVGAEHLAVMAAARRLGRPVRWVQTRSEGMVGMPQGRGQVQWVEMGFDDDARLTGMHCRVLADAGAYAGFGGALAIGPTRMMAQGVYAIPAIGFDVAVAVTNTTPMGAFRGAGRPEAAEMLERMMDIAAAELGVDPVELRRRNLLAPFTEPFTTVMGTIYDTGDYARPLDEALRLAGYRELRHEQAARRARGDRRQLGIGVGVYVEITGAGGGGEFGAVEVHRDGGATIRVGTSAHGQGHATSFSMIVADTLGIPMERIRFVQSDTALVPRGGGTGGSRSLQLGGSAVLKAAEEVLELGRALAASELEATPEDVVVHDGGLGVAGVPSRVVPWGRLAAIAEERGVPGRDGAPAAAGGPLAAELDFDQAGATYPFGAHVSVVEVDMETGHVRPVRHVAVDDCGRILNPLLVTGQQHGGIAQGMAQALWEEVRFDADGNPVTANLAEYAMPSAAEVPFYETANTETPTFRNPLGAKGIGESGTIGSTPAVHTAVVDALSHLGVRHVAMPCTPERVWRAIEAARRGGPDAAGGGRPLWSDPPAAFGRLPVTGEAVRPEAADVDI
ncbi:MAG: xanthine dehydrogenase family protein molybdopterin-binding subunit [Acidimicrobiales bacterium]